MLIGFSVPVDIQVWAYTMKAEDTTTYLRESANKPKELRDIRSGLDDIITENKSLHERINMIEKNRRLRAEK